MEGRPWTRPGRPIWSVGFRRFRVLCGTRRGARMCPAYVAGLIGPGDRKSVQPMAARDGGVSYDQLHHFIARGVWDAAPLEAALLAEADRLVGGDGCLADRRRHGAAEEGRALGRRRAAVRLGAGQERQLPDAGLADAGSRRGAGHGGLRLFLPESWTSDPARLDRRRRARRPSRPTGPSRRSRSPRSTGSAPPACASAACWPMPATA